MKIKSIHVRRFRSIENAALVDCGGLNVLIGKNNAGKSNFLATIELMQLHLKGGVIAGSWPSTRPQDDFTNRASAIPLQIGLEYGLDSSINTKLRDQLKMEAPHLEQSIDQIKSYETIAFVLAGSLQGSKAFVYIEQIAVGNIILESDPLAINGIPLLSVPTSVGQELFELQKEATSLRLDLRALESIDSDRLAPYLGRDLPPSYIVDSSIGNRGSFRLRQICKNNFRVPIPLNKQILQSDS